MRSVLTGLVLIACGAAPAHAELVFFQSGRTQSVRGHRIEGESLVLLLRSGGEIVCEPSLVARIEPDEVPYPEPAEAEIPTVSARPVAGPRTDVRFEPIIRRVAAEQGVDATLVRAVIQVESNYEPRARSRKGAVGLMQVMPATARQYGARNPYDPTANIEVGIKYLRTLLQRLPLHLALAAYNAGEVAVQRFRGIPPYPETQAYVSHVLSLVQ